MDETPPPDPPMYTRTCVLLQNEGFLSQGCLKSSLAALKTGSSSERGALYVAFFNFSIGLERLLKLALILDHCLRHAGAFPDTATLKGFGHNVERLYGASERLLSAYGVAVKLECRLDKIDRDLLGFLAGFAVSGRYFNLDALTGGKGSDDPLLEWGDLLSQIYENDVPELKRVSSEEQVDALSSLLKQNTVCLPGTDLSGQQQSYEEFYQDHGKLTLTLPHVIWRLVKLLLPLKALVFVMRERLQAAGSSTVMDIPYMEEFLDFVGEDRASTFGDSDWPYWQ